MIPRTKVNYSLVQLAHAALVTEAHATHREALLIGLGALFGHHRLLLTPSGRGALYVILQACDKPDVVVPSYTCKAVVEAATMAGKNVRYVDSEPDGFNLNPTKLQETVDDRCCVIATHQFGIPCDIRRIVEICRARGASVVEDAAAALGTCVQGKPVGTFGDVGFFSFDSTKLITVPMKGGLIAAGDEAWHGRIKAAAQRQFSPMPAAHKFKLIGQAAALVLLENHWLYRAFHTIMFERQGRQTTDGPGLNLTLNEFYQYRFAEWQALLALRQLERLQSTVRHRQGLYARLLRGLGSCQSFALPPADEATEWACIRFPIRVKGDKLAFYERGVRAGIDFAFSFTFLARPDVDPQADALAASVLDIPFYSKLSDREFEQVVEALQRIDREVACEGP